jgi:hypothetical protein
MLKEPSCGQRLGGTEETREGVDYILCRYLSTIMKLDPLA